MSKVLAPLEGPASSPVRRFYTSAVVSGVEDQTNGAVAVHVTSDLLEEVPGNLH
ncbi:MAG: hypothetical protein R3C44_18880 [Chloroflexota bacterium]